MNIIIWLCDNFSSRSSRSSRSTFMLASTGRPVLNWPLPALSWLSCPSSLVLPVMFWPSCLLGPLQADLSRFICHVDLSRLLSTLSYPMLSCCYCNFLNISPIPALLSRMPCPSGHILAVLSSLSVQSDMFRLTFQANLSRLTCPSCPVLTILPWLSCPGCPATVILSWLSCSGCSVLTAKFWPSSPLSDRGWCDPADQSGQPVQTELSLLSWPSCPVPDVLSRLPCHGCSFKVVLSKLPCPSCPVLSCSGRPVILFRNSCLAIIAVPTVLSCCPVLTVLSLMPCLTCSVPAVMGCPYMAVLQN